MSRLSIVTRNKAQTTVETLYKDLERRIVASPPGLCPIDLASSFLKLCHAQTCGKCVPCRIGLGELEKLVGAKDLTEILGSLIVKSTGKPSLVHESDNRPSVSPETEAKKVFSDA